MLNLQKWRNSIYIFFLIGLLTSSASALVTEMGLSYSYQKKTFNSTNYSHNDSKSASASVYFFEKLALEYSYTDSFYEAQESDTTSTRTIQQSSQISNLSLIYMMLDSKQFVQPYVKAGVAYIKKNQTVRYQNASAITIPESTGWAPSYGAGLKIVVSDRFSIKLAYEVWQTPLSDGTSSDDSAFKAGLSWYL